MRDITPRARTLCAVAALLWTASAMTHPASGSPRAFDAKIGAREPGCAVLVRERGRTIVARGYGLRAVGGDEPIGSRTNFRLASVTKQFTAMAVMLLVHDGRLGYDTTLADVFPDFPAYGRQITVRHLLTHTAGLPDYEELMEARERDGGPHYTPERQIGDEAVLALLEQEPKPRFAPGSQWAYSNSGYVVLGLIVSRVSGQPFADFLRERVFRPLGMHHTLLYRRDTETILERAYGHERSAAGLVVSDQSSTSASQGDGGVYSNLEDLARWDAALESHRLLPAREMQAALTPVHLADGSEPRWPDTTGDEDNLAPGEPVSYGYGWFLDPSAGHHRMWHFGTTQGFRSALMRYPDDRLTVVVLCNRMDLDARALALETASQYLGPVPGARPR